MIGTGVTEARLTQIDDALTTVASYGDRVFGTTLVARAIGTTKDDAVEMLFTAARAGIVEIQYEIVCTECGATSEVVESPAEIDITPKPCRQCFEVFIPDASDVWGYFKFRPGTLEGHASQPKK